MAKYKNIPAALLIGRKEEISVLHDCLTSRSSELIAVYGRRRVGKTYLIRTVYKDTLCFELTGIYNASLKTQLSNFNTALSTATGKKSNLPVPANWLDAFGQLKDHISKIKNKKKKTIFFDELPWLDTKRSGFLGAFEHFWNSWASRRTDIVIVICGSAASWMIKKIVNSKGGLHNRLTRRIRLLPFSLQETSDYLKSNKVQLDDYQLLQLYMVMGGIPHYLKEVKPGQSAIQNIDRICFTKDGLLFTEFNNLYFALYENAERHIQVIKTLAAKKSGLTRNELIKGSRLSSGGTVTAILEELTESGFITVYVPLDKKSKDALYRLSDEYSLFYLKFIEGTRSTGKNTWVQKSMSASWRSWSGYAFENICLRHVPQLKKELGIEGVYSEESSWRGQYNGQSVQIDLLIDRRDRCINLCEMKFSENVFEITKSYAAELDNKVKTFRSASKTNKTIFLTMVTSFGVKDNIYKNSLVSNSIEMVILFK